MYVCVTMELCSVVLYAVYSYVCMYVYTYVYIMYVKTMYV